MEEPYNYKSNKISDAPGLYMVGHECLPGTQLKGLLQTFRFLFEVQALGRLSLVWCVRTALPQTNPRVFQK